jgi:DNA-directed RNA polymerase specialized sigma24 family protein
VQECESAAIGRLRQLGADDHTIDDAIQEALYRALRSRATYKPSLPLWPWFRKILDNALFDIRRQSGAFHCRTNADYRLEEMQDRDHDPYEQPEALPPAVEHAMVSCLKSLSSVDQLLLDVEMGRLTYRDVIPRIIELDSTRSINEKSLRTAKSRALRRLIACLNRRGLGGNDAADKR